jgi:hypothetical protein
MNKLLITTAILAAIGASPAYATLRLSISDGTTTFTCADGQLGCDLSGGANNLLTVNTAFDGNFVQVTLAQSTFGKTSELQLSSDNISSTSGGTLTFLASDTNFAAPVFAIHESGSVTFNDNVGAGASTLKFWADHANTQGANPNNTPGTLLDTVTGTPTTNPDSFAGTKNSLFFQPAGLFSMTEGASLNFIAGGSATGFNEAMQTISVPEPRSWALMGVGFGFLAMLGWRKRKEARFAL